MQKVCSGKTSEVCGSLRSCPPVSRARRSAQWILRISGQRLVSLALTRGVAADIKVSVINGDDGSPSKAVDPSTVVDQDIA
eukprot:3140635-Lingulodinium_polyedra.AAC.1